MAPQSPFLGGPPPSADARRDPHHGSQGPGLPASLLPTTAEAASGPEGRRGETKSGAPAVEGHQPWPPTRTSLVAQSGTKIPWQPQAAAPPSLPPVATALLPPWAFGATSVPLKDPPGHASSPAHGDLTASSDEGGPGGQEPTALSLLVPGSSAASVWQGSWTPPSGSPPPGLGGAKGPTGPADGATTSLSADELQMPATEPSGPPGATSPLAQAGGSSEGRQATPPVSARQPPMGATDPSPSWLPTLATASGMESDRAAHTTPWGQPPPHTGNTALPRREGGQFQELPGDHMAVPLAGGTRTPFGPGLVLAASLRPSSASPTKSSPMGEGTGETTLLGDQPSQGSLEAPTLSRPHPWQETVPPWGGSSSREGGGQALPTATIPPSSSQAGTSRPMEEQPASPLAPGDPVTPLPLSQDWCSAGQPSREGQAPLPSPTDPSAVVSPGSSPVGSLSNSPSAAPERERGPGGALGKQAGPGELPPRPSPLPPFWPIEGAPLDTSAIWEEGRGGVPTRAGPPVGSTEGPPSPGRLLPSPVPSSTLDLLSEGGAAPTREMGGPVGATSPPPVARHQSWTSTARTWRRKGAEQPGGPTESQRKDIAQQSPGPAQTAVAPLAESLASSSSGFWPPWPPEATPELGSIGREGRPLPATPWLLAAGLGEAPTRPGAAAPQEGSPRGHLALVVENQPPHLKAAFLPVAGELVLAMEFSRTFQDPDSPEYRSLVRSFNETAAPLLASLPGFQRLEVKTIRPGSGGSSSSSMVAVEFEALFLPQAPGLWAALSRAPLSERLPPGLWVGNASVLRSVTQERQLDPCALLFSCRAGYACLAQEDGSALCTSLCHRGFCRNHGICTHAANHTPVCQCPVGHDFWFLGVHCDYKVTQQGLLGAACGLLLSLAVVGVAMAGLVIRRVRLLLLEARADQTKSSYRRFCRLDDVSAHYWSEPWLASTTSLDNPAFSNSEELLHLQRLGPACFGSQGESGVPDGRYRPTPDTARGLGTASRRTSSRHNWAESSSSVNDPMVDSGKASEVSVSSWPMEPLQWSPCPALHKLPRDQASRAPRPNSCCEGLELVNLERSWTA